MHEFLLFSQIPAARHSQVLNILAGVTGSQPVESAEQTLVLQPSKAQQQVIPSKKNVGRQRNLSYNTLIRSARPPTSESESTSVWRHVINETPEPGIKNVLVRAVEERHLPPEELDTFKDPSSYTFKAGYMTVSHRFVHHNIVIKVSRILLPSSNMDIATIDFTPPQVSDCKVLDPSGAYFVEACIRVEDRTQSGISDQATEELLAFRRLMQGSIDLHVVDRLCLDTRVKNV